MLFLFPYIYIYIYIFVYLISFSGRGGGAIFLLYNLLVYYISDEHISGGNFVDNFYLREEEAN